MTCLYCQFSASLRAACGEAIQTEMTGLLRVNPRNDEKEKVKADKKLRKGIVDSA
jgi:hypothetical protein